MEKPKRWFKKKGSKKLTNKAKKYLSFKLKEYWKGKKLQEEEPIIQQEPKDFPIRIWLKFHYTGEKPLFIEAYIEGLNSEKKRLYNYLYEFVASKFNKYVADSCEFGFEKISHINKVYGALRYKHSLTANWKTFR